MTARLSGAALFALREMRFGADDLGIWLACVALECLLEGSE